MDLSAPPKYLMGAIIGDIVGSVYEFFNIFTEDFPLFSEDSHVTDDSVLTCAVAQAFILSETQHTSLYDDLVGCMQSFGRHFPDAAYGRRFSDWVWESNPKPYGSWGNGAPMRCSPAGWITNSWYDAEEYGEATAEPTHNHPDAVRAAGTTASLICMARNGKDKPLLLSYVNEKGYDLPTMGQLRKTNVFTEMSTPTMKAALACFFASNSFEDCIRKSISIGGDSDTIAAIAGSIAEAYYGIPDDILNQAWTYVPKELRLVLHKFNDTFIK